MPWLDVLGQHGIDATLASAGHELQFSCPLCQDVKKRFYLNATSGAWICHRCEERGSGYDFCRKVLELDHFQSMRALKQASKEEKPAFVVRALDASPRADGIEMPEGIHLLKRTDVTSHEYPFWNYLYRRGLDELTIRRHKIGYAIIGRYAYRVVVPVFTKRLLRTFVARSIVGGVEPKVLRPEQNGQQIPALFGIDDLKSSTVFLVEGVFDAMRIGDHAVATLGTNLSPEQRDLLRQAGVHDVVLLWDGDDAGRIGSARVADQLSAAMFNVKVALLPPGQDPASASWETLISAIDQAEPNGSYLSNKLSLSRLDVHS